MKSFKIIWKSSVILFLLFAAALFLSVPATVRAEDIQLTFDKGIKYSTDWSPNGKWITYERHASGVPRDIFIVPAKGGTPINLTTGIDGQCWFPKFNYNSQEVNFTQILSGMYTIMSVDISQLDKKNPKPIEPRIIRENALHGRWSHGGRYLAYTDATTTPWKLCVWDRVQDKSWPIGDGSNAPIPSWSHNDSHVILCNSVDDDLSLISIPREGGDTEILYQLPLIWNTDVSPNGKWILFDQLNLYWVFVYNAPTEVVSPLNVTTYDWSPAFSPNGQQFCYSRWTGPAWLDFEIFISDFNPPVAKPAAEAAPAEFALSQNSPNPFNPSTTISFSLAKTGNTTIEVFNITGQKVETLINASLSAGSHSVTWNAARYSAGVYFYRITSGDFTNTMKMIFAK